jgi:nicotinamidase-related amidase
VAQIARILQLFRQHATCVIYTSNSYANPDEATVFREKLPALNELVAGGPWAEIDSRVAPIYGEMVIRKTVPSAFFDSALRQVLRDRGVDAVVVCGFSTSGCIRATALDALQCGLRVTVAADACGDRDQQAHEYNLRDMQLKTGDVLTTDQILAACSVIFCSSE